jgi:hypothetical protein
MRPICFRRALGAAALLLSFQAQAVVEAGHWGSTTVPPFSGVNFTIRVDQTQGGDYTDTYMFYNGNTLTGEGAHTDEGADIFVVKAGDVLSNAFIANTAPPFIMGPSIAQGLPRQSNVAVGHDFYLGTRTRSFSDPGFTYEGSFFSSFGWAHFKTDSAGQLQLLDSAMAFREGGIVVGTLQAVPEPSSAALMALGLICLALAWRQQAAAPKAPRL